MTKSRLGDATYTHADFKRDVLSVLEGQYGSAVKAGDKAIAIDASVLRRKSDVIVATQFRRYFKFRSAYGSEYVEGTASSTLPASGSRTTQSSTGEPNGEASGRIEVAQT